MHIPRYLSIHDFYYLWCITFPSKDPDKEKQNVPPILLIPQVIILESECSVHEKPDESLDLEYEVNNNKMNEAESHRVIRLPANKNFKLFPVCTQVGTQT